MPMTERMTLPRSIEIIRGYFDDDRFGSALAGRVDGAPTRHLEVLAEQLLEKQGLPPVGYGSVVALEELMLPARPYMPFTESPNAAMALLFHDVVLAVDQFAAWADDYLLSSADERSILRAQLARLIQHLPVALPLLESGAMALVPPPQLIDQHRQRIYDDLDPRHGGPLTEWGPNRFGRYHTLADPLIAPLTLDSLDVEPWELESRGLPVSSAEELSYATSVLLDDLIEEGDDLLAISKQVLVRLHLSPTQVDELTAAMQLREYGSHLRHLGVQLLSAKTTVWTALEQNTARPIDTTGPEPATVEFCIPAIRELTWRDIAALREHDETFARVRSAFADFRAAAGDTFVGVAPGDLQRVRRAADEHLIPVAEQLRSERGRRKATIAGAGALVTAGIRLTQLLAPVARTFGGATRKALEHAQRKRSTSTAAAIDIIGLIAPP